MESGKEYQMLPAVERGHRFLELDSLRGLAAMAVVLGHFRGGLATAPPAAFVVATRLPGTGHAAVLLFFLLSGFVLTVPYLGSRRPTYAAFLIKRLCRIYLPYVAAIALAALLAAKLYNPVPTGNAWIDQTWNRPFSGHLLLQHLLMIGHFDDVQWNTAIWSLIIEMRVSIAFPVIAWITARVRPFALLALCVPGTVVVAALLQRSGHGMACDTLFYSMIFVIGSLARRHYDWLRAVLSRQTTMATVSLLVLGVACYEFGEKAVFPSLPVSRRLAAYIADWVVVFGCVVLVLLATTWQPLRHLLHNPVALWAGTRSYSIYLLHGTMLFTLIRLHQMQRLSAGVLVLYLAIVFASAEVFHRLVERPALVVGRRLGSRSVCNRWPAGLESRVATARMVPLIHGVRAALHPSWRHTLDRARQGARSLRDRR